MTGLILALLRSFTLLASIIILTWNAKWFPSGRADHRASPEKEAATIKTAAGYLRQALDDMDSEGTNDVIIVLNEMINRQVAKELIKEIGRTNLNLAAVSQYRRHNNKIDYQQDAVATTLPVASANFSHWRKAAPKIGNQPPRGMVIAELIVAPAVTSRVYAVHLKSNYGAKTDEDYAKNRAKRHNAVQELLGLEKLPKSKKKRNEAMPAIIAGDFNADAWNDEFAQETIFNDLKNAGFENPLEQLPAEERITYPGYGQWKNRTYDYIMLRDFKVLEKPKIIPIEDISDHNAVILRAEAIFAP